MKISFDPPTIIGALCEREEEIPAGLLRRFTKLKPRFALLPFRVERRYLKNLVACMQLMDIQGLAIFGRHQQEIVQHLPRLSPAARKARKVDIVLRKGRRFWGHHLLTELEEGHRYCVSRGRGNGLASRKMGMKTKRSEIKLMGLFCQTAVDLLTAGKIAANAR